MFKYRQTHYGQDVSYHCDLICRFSAVPVKLPASYCLETDESGSEVSMETQRAQKSRCDTRKHQHIWRTDGVQLQGFLECYNDQDSVVLVQEKTSR